MAEAAVLCWLAPPARSLAGQVTAVAPLAVFHDLRWIYGYDRSWPGFAGLLVAVLGVRSGLNTALARLAWPRDRPGPALREMYRSATGLTVVACLLLSPVAALTLGVAILPFSWPFLATVPVLLLISLPLSHGGILGSWWRTLPPARAMYWLLADFVTLSVVAAAIGRLPVTAAIGVCGLAGVANARAWFGVTRAIVRREASRRRLVGVVARHPAPLLPLSVPLAPVAMVLAITMVVGLTRLAFVIGNPPHPASLAAAAAAGTAGTAGADAALGSTPPAVSGGASGSASSVAPGLAARDPVLEIRGFGSVCCASPRSLRPVAPGALVQQFSYRGMTASGRPLPQGSAASDLPLTELGSRLAAQVLRLHRDTGRPVDIIAESEGTLGVDAMLAAPPGPATRLGGDDEPHRRARSGDLPGRPGPGPHARGRTAGAGLVRGRPVPVRVVRGGTADRLGGRGGSQVRGLGGPASPAPLAAARAAGRRGHAARLPAAPGRLGGARTAR